MSNILPIFSQKIKELRKDKKWSQAKMASAIGYSLKEYQSWERGERSPSIIALPKIAEAFGVSCDHLLGLIKEKNHDLQFIHDCTGLSENSIGFLSEMTHSHTEDDRRKLEVINLLLDDSKPENYDYWKRIQAFLFTDGGDFNLSLSAGDYHIERDELLSTLLTLNNAYLIQLKSKK